MRTQTIIWTALPRRRDGRNLHLSVFVTPRLKTDEGLPRPQLRGFDDFNRWPEKLTPMTFEVQFEKGPTVEALRTSADPQMQLWRDIFKETAYVRPYKFEKQTERIIRTFPVRNVLSYLKNIYRRIGENSPSELPSLRDDRGRREASLQDMIDDIGGVIWQDLRRLIHLEHTLLEQKAFDPRSTDTYGLPSKSAFDFYQVNRFYNRAESKESMNERLIEPDLGEVPPPPELPDVDFHQALSSLADYPILMRRLGLVIDLSVRDPGEPFAAIRIKPGWGEREPASVFNRDVTPWTNCVLTREQFLARPRPTSDLSDGMLKMERTSDRLEPGAPSAFDLVQVDADGAALKALHFAGNMRRLHELDDGNRAALDTPEDAGLPSLRSAGIAVTRLGRAYNLAQTFKDLDARNNFAEDKTPPVEFFGEKIHLFADDLVRGYRVDVRDRDNPGWLSLCQRLGRYRLVDDEGNTLRMLEDDAQVDDEGAEPDTWIQDEGYIKGASTTSKDGQASDLYLHETFVRWDGWSVCAERPGKTIKPVKSGLQQDEVPEKIPNRAATEFRLETEFKAAPNTLPRLRYGKRYQVRARVVDLAGNSLPPDTDGDANASEEIIYTRFEPIIPPAVVPRRKFTEGESVERMVIRSNYSQAAEDYVASPAVAAFNYQSSNERHLVPPKTSQLMAETHGMFEAFFGQGKDYDLGYRIALKEAGTLMDDRVIDITQPLDPVTKQPATIPVTGLEVVINPKDEEMGQYILHDTDTLLLPYLPDPLARGAALRDLPGLTLSGTPELEKVIDETKKLRVLKVPFDMKWPDAQAFRIRIVERPGSIEEGDCTETFERAEDPPVWDAERRVLTIFLAKAQVARIRYSCYPGKDEAGRRDIGQMGIYHWLRDSARLKELELYMEAGTHWMLTPFREMVLVHAVQQPLCAPRIDDKQFNSFRNVGETSAALSGIFHLSTKSTGKIELLADWEMWVDDLSDAAPKRVKGSAHVCERKVEDSFPDALPTYRLGGIRHEFGDTKYRSVEYHLLGTTRFREYFPPEITGDPEQITRRGPKRRTPVRNSARPAAPKVLYAVPSFRWDEESSPPDAGDEWREMRKRRTGGALRVYMERPWYSTGDEELLGVVLPPPSPLPRMGYSDRMKPFVTQIGIDPLWSSELTGRVLKVEDFDNFKAARDDLSLEELDERERFPAVGFEPEYNQERGLWYCDIQFKPEAYKSYYPFVRLALARFQPNSVPNAHLSRVVLSDFAQIAPDRSLNIIFRDESSFTASLSGYTNFNRQMRVEFIIEEHDEGIPGDFGWRAIAGTKEQPSPLRVNPKFAAVNEPTLWQANMRLPSPRGSKQFRLVVKEYEPFKRDNTRLTFISSDLDYRLVFAGEVRL